MKKLILPALLLVPFLTYGQTVSWTSAGNALTSGGVLGTTSAQAVSIRTNNTELINLSSSGAIKFSTLTGTASGLMQLSSTGTVSRLNFPGDALQLLNGNGGWSDYATMSGWSPSTGIITTTRKLGIGVTTPAQALEVSGNGNEIKQYSVYTMSGQLVTNKSIEKVSTFTINLENLERGMYQIKFELADKQNIVKKFVKSK
jgi:hypothetical protein